MWILETNDGDKWSYDENKHENARRDQWIFGGKLIHIKEDKDIIIKKIVDKKRHKNYIIYVYFILIFFFRE